MKNKIYLSLVLVAVLCLVGWTGFAQKSSPARQTWEYKEFRSPVGEKELNELGAQGWELVAVLENLSISAGSGYGRPTYYLKRAK